MQLVAAEAARIRSNGERAQLPTSTVNAENGSKVFLNAGGAKSDELRACDGGVVDFSFPSISRKSNQARRWQ
jgi:hypothetical protein